MRTIEMSGGLELGPPEGPWIDGIALDYHTTVTIDEMVAAVLQPSSWEVWRHHVTPVTKGFTGVYTVTNGITVRFLYRNGSDPTLALRTIEQHEQAQSGYLSHALAGAALAASQAKVKPTAAPSVIAMACNLRTSRKISDPLSSNDLDALITRFIVEAPRAGGQYPTGPVDRARFCIRLARRLWHPSVLTYISKEGLPMAHGIFLGSLAAAALNMDQPDHIQVGVMQFPSPQAQMAITMLWPQVLEWYAGNISTDALRYVTRGSVPASQEMTIDRVIEVDGMPPTPPAHLVYGLTRQLLRDAAQKGVYQPTGNFTLALPADYPLRDWGVCAMRISASPTSLWCAVVDHKGEIGACFKWLPGEPLLRWVVTETAEPILQVTMAALWRDLRVAGEAAVPPQEGTRTAQRGAVKTQERTRPTGQPDTIHRYLPRPGVRAITGDRQWGNTEEREAIHRRAHGVRAYLRREERHSKAAEETAEEYGWIIPQGYTFVRPHTRGMGEATTAERQVIVHAKGLATVMALV